jgi:hypothetical protein
LGLYDIGSENGVSYIVPELVAGETLRARIEHGPLPISKLLDIAVQVAEGMACGTPPGSHIVTSSLPTS